MYFETDYFTTKSTADRFDVAIEIVRRQPSLRGQCAELVELLSIIITHGKNDRKNIKLLIDPSDSLLGNDLQIIGLSFAGYLTNKESEAGLSCELLGSRITRRRVILRPHELNSELNKFKIIKLIYEFNGVLRHDPRVNAREYFTFCRVRERFFYGITKSNYLPSELLEKKNQTLPWNSKPEPRKNNNFNEILEMRRSPQSFVANTAIPPDMVKSVVLDAYAFKNDRNRPTGFAGGIGDYDLHIVSQGGNCCYSWETESFEPSQQPMLNYEKISHIFTQKHLANASGVILLVCNIDRLIKKYGTRAYRMVFLDAGGLCHQLHLSLISYSLQGRIVAGFDDQVIEKSLALPNHKMLAASVVFGKEKI